MFKLSDVYLVATAMFTTAVIFRIVLDPHITAIGKIVENYYFEYVPDFIQNFVQDINITLAVLIFSFMEVFISYVRLVYIMCIILLKKIFVDTYYTILVPVEMLHNFASNALPEGVLRTYFMIICSPHVATVIIILYLLYFFYVLKNNKIHPS